MREENLMDKKKLYCFLFIIILTLGLITPILLYLFYPGKVITLDFEYDSSILGSDIPIENLAVNVDAPSGFLGTFYTGSLGQISINILESGDYTYDYTWKNVGTGPQSLDESISAQVNITLDAHQIDPMFYYTTLDLFTDPIDLLWYNGSAWVSVTTIDPQGTGSLASPLDGLFLGTFMFENANDTFVIAQNTLDDSVSEVYISPIGVIVSIILGIIIIIGVIIYKKLKSKRFNDSVITGELEILALTPFLFSFPLNRIISIQVSKVKSFPLFLNTLLYNETKTSSRLFHYSEFLSFGDFTLKANYK